LAGSAPACRGLCKSVHLSALTYSSPILGQEATSTREPQSRKGSCYH